MSTVMALIRQTSLIRRSDREQRMSTTFFGASFDAAEGNEFDLIAG